MSSSPWPAGDQFSCLRKTVRENRDTGQVHAGFWKEFAHQSRGMHSHSSGRDRFDIANAEAAQLAACLFAVTTSNQKRLPHCQPVWRFSFDYHEQGALIHAGACDTVYCITPVLRYISAYYSCCLCLFNSLYIQDLIIYYFRRPQG